MVSVIIFIRKIFKDISLDKVCHQCTSRIRASREPAYKADGRQRERSVTALNNIRDGIGETYIDEIENLRAECNRTPESAARSTLAT